MNAPTDLAALKTRQQAAWASGDYAVIGTTLQIVGERLAEACDLRTDERVLDVAAGNGNASLAAARRGCRVTSTDYVPTLLDRGAERAAAERLSIEFQARWSAPSAATCRRRPTCSRPRAGARRRTCTRCSTALPRRSP
jgi:tRNA/tmRNA/rRNA uracil-C5-methylase (TrmA/RlmC/RlmD family)